MRWILILVASLMAAGCTCGDGSYTAPDTGYQPVYSCQPVTQPQTPTWNGGYVDDAPDCVIGESFCSVTWGYSHQSRPALNCAPVPGGCPANPDCDCLCAEVDCTTGCSCVVNDGGIASVACDQV